MMYKKKGKLRSQGVEKKKVLRSHGVGKKKKAQETQGVRKQVLKSRGHGVIYARQSSGSSWTHGQQRQFDAGEKALTDHFNQMGVKKFEVSKVGEIRSGSLPLSKRKVLIDLITNPKVDAIGVENLRAVARKMLYGELIYELAKAHGKRIVPRDMPDIFDLNPHPNQSYSRR